MVDSVQYDLCPETGIGCVMVRQAAGLVKIDLMPAEVAALKLLIQAGNLAGARALLADINPAAEAAMDADALAALAREVA